MTKRVICAALLAASLLWSAALRPRAAAPGAELTLTAPAAVLIERTTGTVLYEKNAHDRLPPASVTKVMTLLLVFEALDQGRITWDDAVTASETAAAKGGSQIFLEPGETMPIRDMIKAVVVSSANDCATALAEHVAGSEESFVAMMNARAAKLGMNDTHFVNCTGLDDEPGAAAHLTSAFDIALMSRALLAHDEVRQFTTIWMDTVRDGRFGLANTNKLIRFYPGATGLKTGFTASAGYCLSASAERSGVEFIAVAMHCDTAAHRNADCKAMLDYGFANFSLVSPMPEEPLTPVPVRLGTADAVTPVLSRTDSLLLGKQSAGSVTKTLELSPAVEAPVEAGQTLGKVTLSSGGKVLEEIPVVAAEAVPRLTWKAAAVRIFGKICFGA